MVLGHEDPCRVLYRSERPALEPEGDEERDGVVNDVVFPTALDALGSGRIDVYYGMADSKIGVARLSL